MPLINENAVAIMFLRISTKSLAATLTSWGMFILFPGFLLYHMLLAMGIFPAFVGGLFGPISLVYFIVFLILFPFTFRRIVNASQFFYISSIIFFIYCMFWILAHCIIIDEPYIRVAAIQASATVIVWLALFFIGIHFSYEHKITKRLFVLMFVATFCFLTHFTLTTGKVMFYATEFQALEDYSSVSTYQGFARSSLVSALLLLCYTQSVYKRIMIVMMSIFVLFFLGARSELYGFVFLLTMFLMAFSNKSVLRLVLSIGLLAAIAFIVVSNFEWLSESRQFEIMNLSQSTSMVGRLEFQEVGLGQLADNPVFGFFGGHIVDTGSVGGYVHNALSAWLAFGILGFVVYMSLTVVATLNSLFFFVKYRTLSSHWTFAFMVNCFCLLMMITSKSVYWILPGLGWGLYINAMVRQNSEKNVHLGNTLKLFVEPN